MRAEHDCEAHILPEDVCEALRFITGRGTGANQAIWNRQLRKVMDRARAPLPGHQKLRNRIDPERSETRDRLLAPLRKELMQQNGTGGSDWCDQFTLGFPTLGEFGEPGVFSLISDFSEIVTRKELPKSASSRFVTSKKGRGPKAEELRRGAISQAKRLPPRT